MPPRKKKKRVSRKQTAISLTGVAESILLANVGTRMAFNLNAWDFISDGWTNNTKGRALGSGELSLHEMIYGNMATPLTLPSGGTSYSAVGTSNLDVIANNIQNGWVKGAIQAVAIPVGFRLGKRLLRKPLAMVNKGFKMAGIRDMVRA